MLRSLPYPGHTWSFTQHAPGFVPKTVYEFLKCVAPFEGQTEGYNHKITALMIASGILTPNERGGTYDAWRDYQQILVELGLLYSTKTFKTLTITEAGQMLLAGDIGFSELINIQGLRYQYPNGHKTTIQTRLKQELSNASIYQPETLTELQIANQILLKPGLLILRVLIGLLEQGEQAYLYAEECQAFLLPCKRNTEWPIAVSEIIRHRKKPSNIENVNRHARRNIQDWFKFLTRSDFFIQNGRSISLSQYSLNSKDLIINYCDKNEDASSFWIPTGFDPHSRLSWFRWYGSVPYSAQTFLRTDIQHDSSYVNNNFIAGIEEDTDEILTSSANINLKPLDIDQLCRDKTFSFSDNIDEIAESFRQGAQKRHAKSLLHDRIIKYLAEQFISQGASVKSDPDSIDLFASWPDGTEAIFEVKTVTRRSIQGRLRTAIGQVEEYAYRHISSGNKPADRVIVLNAEIEDSAWQRSFLTEYLNIGLVCKKDISYRAYAPETFQTKNHWLSL